MHGKEHNMKNGNDKTVLMGGNKENNSTPVNEKTLPLDGTAGRTILVVDDEELMRELLTDALKDAGYEVLTAPDCEAAQKILEERPLGLVISDINLPGSSGTDLLQMCLREYKNIEIILITGAPDLQVAVQAVRDGAFDYISKPIAMDELLKRVAAAFDNALQKTQLHLTASDTTVDMPGSGYSIVKTLGTGSMGIVMLVTKGGRQYAIKIMRQEFIRDATDERMRRFEREAEILASIDHPNVIKVYEYGLYDKDGVPYIVMEYVPGNDLDFHMRAKSLLPEEQITIIRDVASALSAVHHCGILHRDIKPANILLTDSKQVKLTDFGIARISDSDLTLTFQTLGTPCYMAPEAFESSKNLGPRSDIFSLGVVCYELMTGIKPFDGDALADIMCAIREEKPEEPLAINPGIPDFMQDIMAKMLTKNPAERFESADEIVTAIDTRGGSPKHSGFTRKLLRSLLVRNSPWC